LTSPLADAKLMRYLIGMIFLTENIGLIILVVVILIGGLIGQAFLRAEYRRGFEDGRRNRE
jgi:UPF0716 family protein affecting phage T7 exclusion